MTRWLGDKVTARFEKIASDTASSRNINGSRDGAWRKWQITLTLDKME